MDENQFYPTPESLARKAWAKFACKEFTRVLEPSAGRGDLAKQYPGRHDSWRRTQIDCCEIDVGKHSDLKAAGLTVVGIDFMQFSSAAAYSHIIMNPPFRVGAQHTLKAWDILFDGEIVAIVNAETVRNPYTKEREMLVRLIEQHGSVEYIQEAFLDPDTYRKTEVEVALVHLVKKANYNKEIVGDILDNLKRDTMTDRGLMDSYREMNELALPTSYIENAELVFKAAVHAMRQSVQAEARANHYAALIGKTLTEMSGEGSSRSEPTIDFVRTELGKRYDELKDRAWSNILRSTDVLGKLSSNAQKRLESEFENIKKLEFSESNIRGFLLGLVEKQGDIQIGMACDVFDQLTKYYTDNTSYYRGWKSNNAHRTCGIRLKGTRFVLPGHQSGSWRKSAEWDTLQLLRDIDKVFALLNGEQSGEQSHGVSLAWLFENRFDELRTSKRMSTEFFDVRYYKGIGTIHFYPKGTTLIDRLNRLVGKHRQWLPPEGERVPEGFWLQYEQSEKMDKELREEIAKLPYSHRDPLWQLTRSYSDNEKSAAEANLDALMTQVQGRHGIRLGELVDASNTTQLPLLLAA